MQYPVEHVKEFEEDVFQRYTKVIVDCRGAETQKLTESWRDKRGNRGQHEHRWQVVTLKEVERSFENCNQCLDEL